MTPTLNPASQSAVKGFEAVTVTDVLVVSRDTPTLGAFSAAGRTFGDEAFTLKEPSSNSTGEFSFDSSDDTVLRVNKTTGRAVVAGAGKATVTVAQAATTDFYGAAKSFVLTIKKGAPEFGAFADVARVFGEPEFVIPKPVSESKGAVSFTSSNTGVASVDGASGRVSVTGAGTTTITAIQAGNNDFFGTSKSMVLTVRQATPAIGAFAGASKTFGDAEFTLVKPSSSSSGSFSFSSSNSDVVRVDGDGRVTVVGAGIATVTATQAATANFTAGSVATTVTIGRATTSIANLVLSNLTYGASDVTVAPRSNNPSPFTYTSNTPSVLAVNASTGRVTVVGAGTATITVRQASSANFEAGSESITVQIARATPTLSSFSALSKDYGDAPFALTPPVSNSPAPFTYTSSNPAVASVNETTGVVTLLNVTSVGSPVVLTARQAQTDNYVTTSATTTLTIGRGTPVFGNFTIPSKTYGAPAFTLAAPSTNSSGSFTFSSSNAAIASINSTTGEVTLNGIGSVLITATQEATTRYVGASITATLVVDATAVTGISAGAYHTCLRTSIGAAQCFGQNNYGQLGDTTNTLRTTAVSVSALSSGVAAVSVGGWHSCALMDAGSVKCWGRNDWGNLGNNTSTLSYAPVNVVGLNATAVKVVTTSYSSCVLTSVGGVKCWGHGGWGLLGNGSTSNSALPVNVTGLTSGVLDIEAGDTHMCAIKKTGALVCWGYNDYGQLGDGSRSQQVTPTEVSGLDSGVVSIAPGRYHSCAVLASGTAKCWGYNGDGQLGDNTWNMQIVPTTVYGSDRFISADSGERHTCAITAAGALKCWGDSYNGLGDGTGNRSNVPLSIPTMTSGVRAVSAGSGWHSCALTTSGAVRCWGRNSEGQLGDSTTTQRLSPTAVAGVVGTTSNLTVLGAFSLPGSGYTETSPGFTIAPPTSNREGAFTFASTNPATATINATTGAVIIVGGGSTLFTATQAATATHTAATAYVSLAFLPVVTQLSLAYHNSCALTNQGGMKCWGYNGWGQIGSAASGVQTTPINVPGYTSGIAAIAEAHHATCALTTAGAVSCWGWGGHGGLGSGIPSGVIAITSGYAHTCALMAYGGVKCWGYNGYGQLGDGTTNEHEAATDVIGLSSGVVAIDAGMYHTCAVLTTGAAKCWGSNDQQQLGDGATGRKVVPTQVTGLTSGVASISAGLYHTCAVLATGAAKCWGANDYGQLGDTSNSYRSVPTDVSTLSANVAEISAGWEHTCARLTTGAAKCWGRNNEGELGDGTNSSRNVPVSVVGLSSGVTSIETGQSLSTCATVTGNNVKCWGYNEWGQLGDGTQTHRNTPVDITQLLSGTTSATTLGALSLPVGRFSTTSADFTLAAPTSSRTGDFTFSSSNTEVASVNATTGVVHIEGIGTAVLAARIGGDGKYLNATSKVTITVESACAVGGVCSVGDTGPGGGVVFYVHPNDGSFACGADLTSTCKYLEAAPSSSQGSRSWSTGANQQSGVTGAGGTGIGIGHQNTAAISAQSGNVAASSAAVFASSYTNNAKSDWYLSSKDELNELCKYARNTGQVAGASLACSGGSTPTARGFVADWYWSSTQSVFNGALDQNFSDGAQGGDGKDWVGVVRPIRAFAPLTSCQLAMSCAVGDIGPAGGRIIYVNTNESNEYDYVEAAPSDIASTVWCSGPKATTLIGGTDAWRRQADAAQSHGGIQLRNCTTGGGLEAHNYSANGFTGWGVPNVGLVQLMRTNLHANNVGDFTAAQYMTSNEQDQNDVITVNMADGTLAYPAKTVASRLRPVRFFVKADRRKTTPALAGLSVPSNSFTYGDADFTVSTTSTGLNEWGGSFTSFGTITYTSSNTAVATVNAYTGLVSIVSPGSFTITATQSTWGVFKTPTAVSNNFSVSYATPTLTGFALPNGSFRADDAPFDVVPAVTNGPGAITYSSANTAIATINATTGRVTLVGAGTVTLTATVAASGYWNARSTTLNLSVGALCADGGECRIGDVGPGGGKIFLLPSSTGNTTGKFFEAAPADLSTKAWCNNQSLAGANGYVIGTGEANTIAIDAICTSGAGQSAADYANNGYGDWYLPSLDELTAMLAARTTIGGFATASYWSSSEENWQAAKRLGFPDGVMSGHDKLQYFRVRPIRSFEIKRSCLDIKNSTGTNANGEYTIALSAGGAVINTQVYCLMDSAIDGGGWTMVMKSAQGSTAFGYEANYWTTANTLNPSDASLTLADAKYNTFNYLSATDMLAVFPDVNISSFGSTERGSIDGHNYGWTWKQAVPSGPKTALEVFNGSANQFVSLPSAFAGWNGSIFSAQGGFQWYGFNYSGYAGLKARWGFGWNNEGDQNSNDVTGGIGLTYGNWSAGDRINCCQTTNGVNRSMAMQMFVR